MNNLERERDFYRQQSDELGARVLRLQGEQTRAWREAQRSRTTASLLHAVYRLADSDVSDDQIGQRFLRVLLDTLIVDRVALFQYVPEIGHFVTQHTLGFPETDLPDFTPLDPPEPFVFANSRTEPAPLLDCLRHAAGVPHLLWAFHSRSGLALLAGNASEDQHLRRPFEAGDREILEGALNVFAELVERQQAQRQRDAVLAALRESEERYRTILDSVEEGYFEVDLTGNFTFFNESMRRMLGYSADEMMGMNYRQYMDGETAQKVYRAFNRVFRTGEPTRVLDWLLLRKDDTQRDIEVSVSLIRDAQGEPSGFRGIARDVTRENRVARSNQALFRIAKALPLFRKVNQLLDFIIKEVRDLIGVEGASVILIDEEKKEFYFPATTFADSDAGKKLKEIRFSMDEGVAGRVYQTGQPMIVPDTSQSPYFFKEVDEQTHYQTRNMLDVPIRIQDRMIGVLCAVNKRDREFDQADAFLLGTIASTVALPIENARINEELKRSYEEVQSLNRAKDRVIHHLSHELKTPVSVLAASLNLLKKRAGDFKEDSRERVLTRMQRNLDRILEMQYEIEDILRGREYESYYMLSTLLDLCSDELEALASDNLCEADIVEKIRDQIEEHFGPREAISKRIFLDEFVTAYISDLRSRFAHRKCNLTTHLTPVVPIWVPPDVLAKILEGLVRNAVENTPDKGKIEVRVKPGKEGPELIVKDFGVGITEENKRLIFESNFSTRETLNYSSRKHFDFNAGGRGFDLLRMKIFSERYHFKIRMVSNRCRYIPRDMDLCPGDIDKCSHCRTEKDCLQSGGTTMTVRFLPAEKMNTKNNSSVDK